ncbi:MAG TPA: hypothetical protein VMD59_07140, partial [Acidimicrobiales bacterium]|nr:hypothetical protein [Acidimicrobiales bacterium]
MFLLGFAVSFVCMAGWSFASPLFSGPDEPVHVIKAAAVVRGQLLGDLLDGPSSPFAEVHIPAFYATTRNLPTC